MSSLIDLATLPTLLQTFRMTGRVAVVKYCVNQNEHFLPYMYGICLLNLMRKNAFKKVFEILVMVCYLPNSGTLAVGLNRVHSDRSALDPWPHGSLILS